MTPRRIAVFFYGLFMDEALLRSQGFAPEGVEPALVHDMALRIGQRATLIPEPGDLVHGMLMRLSHAEIDRLYGEDSVAVYRPEAVAVELRDGSRLPALSFNLPAVPAPGEANPAYVEKLRRLGARLGFPEVYLARLGCAVLR